MKNFIRNGDMNSVTSPAGGIASGQGVLVGSLFGVAAKAAAEGESVEIATVGVYELPKAPATVVAQGARVAWDDTAKQVVLARRWAFTRSAPPSWPPATAQRWCASGRTA
jgi:predicted RecA/RadA family phage recombinase